jgi:UDP-N-acetylmuramoyl-tripeptide--D-alanyl-D-alanine ligase
MQFITCSELINAVKGRRTAGRTDLVFTGVSIDSRSVRKGDLFIAIVGKRLDGHAFAPEAVKRGAAGILAAKKCLPAGPHGDLALVTVRDTTQALQDLAAWHRRRFSCPIVAVTGSNGKTTTKDLTWFILSQMYKTIRSQGSKNNHIGVPLTLLEVSSKTQAAVVELGTSNFGEIRDLASICLPDIGCITNIGPAHLEFFGSVENVASAKAELLEEMREGLPVVLNADDAWCEWLRHRAKGPTITFGINHPADFMAEEIQVSNGTITFRLLANLLGVRRFVQLPFPGSHNVYNALAAAAVSSQLGADISDMKEGLRQARLPSMRYELSSVEGLTIVNDAYNANPYSTLCALSSFCEMDVQGKRILVCGDMLELGDHAREAHRQIGFFIAGQPIDFVIALGQLARVVVNSAFGKDASPGNSAVCRSVDEVVSVLMDVAEPGDAVLIKGSRANGMERIVDALKTGLSLASKEVR